MPVLAIWAMYMRLGNCGVVGVRVTVAVDMPMSW
jgi:hypothetical protein